jgi:threonine dehydratase
VDAPAEIWLKLENLQPIGSFKLRGAANAVLSAPREALADGLVTTSTGNMAQGVAWMARELGVPATIVAPHNASMSKLAAVERMGGRIERRSWDEWWEAMEAGHVDGIDGYLSIRSATSR